MQARIMRVGEIVVVHLAGRVDVETAEPFRKACLNALANKKVVFDFQSLSFVGSSGILPFLETMQSFAEQNANRFKFSGVGSEFKKVFAATTLNSVEIYDTHAAAVQEFLTPTAARAVPLVAEVAPLNGTPLGLALNGAPVMAGATATPSVTVTRTDGVSTAIDNGVPRREFGLLSLRPFDESDASAPHPEAEID